MSAQPGYTSTPDARGGLAITADLAHPFYFDHGLGHLPGLLLLDMSLHAIGQAAREDGSGARFTAFDIDFRAITALTPAVRAEVDADGASGGWRCRLTQEGRLRAETRAVVASGPSTPAAIAPDGSDFTPMDRRFVRKADPANVFIGSAVQDAWAIRPSGSCSSSLQVEADGAYSPVYLVECFLQLCRTRRPEAFATEQGLPASREILVMAGGRLPAAVPAHAQLTLVLDEPSDPTLPPPRRGAIRRFARLLSGETSLGAFYCDAIAF
ncbi:hypothetical protein [Marinivivus vitaminiproducens]|uniref:hypothetical protein n=1 Tax=Marinivivus vitaminiproducens TaxID=3035935 RepID=UPI0027A5564F|nr:hypothetical protein P4R82_11590 [Geminicoccaceae bacterium SCSIO 64248]